MPVLNRRVLVRLVVSVVVAILAVLSVNFLHPYMASEDPEYISPTKTGLFIGFFVFWALSSMVIFGPLILKTRKSQIHPFHSMLFIIPAVLLSLFIVSKLVWL